MSVKAVDKSVEDLADELGFTVEQLRDPMWRLSNLYTVADEKGHVSKFVPNAEQIEFYERFWYLNVILKARQLGFTTWICLIALDQALFNDGFNYGCIAQTKEDALKLFRTKIRDVYNRLPSAIREAMPLKQANKSSLIFENDSSMYIGTSLRGGTLQMLHITEFGKIAAKYPANAREIKTGAFNTVHAGQWIVVESTSEGAGGEFFELVEDARRLAQQKRRLTPLDFRFHFFAWWRRPEYCLSDEDAADVVITPNDTKYFDDLEGKVDVSPGVPLELSLGQRAWYVKKAASQKKDMKREFPSTADEAFEVAIEGAWYTRELQLVRRRHQVGNFPWIPGVPVNTFWDLGGDDETAIWFHQRVNKRDRMIAYYENSGEGLAHYVKYLHDTGFDFGKHYLPHDADQRHQGETLETKYDILVRLRLRGVLEVVPRVKEITDGIESVRSYLPLTDFNEEDCSDGLAALASYTRQWNKTLAKWTDHPLHNWASNGSDAFRQYGQIYPYIENNSGVVVKQREMARDSYEAAAAKTRRTQAAKRRGYRVV